MKAEFISSTATYTSEVAPPRASPQSFLKRVDFGRGWGKQRPTILHYPGADKYGPPYCGHFIQQGLWVTVTARREGDTICKRCVRYWVTRHPELKEEDDDSDV